MLWGKHKILCIAFGGFIETQSQTDILVVKIQVFLIQQNPSPLR
jgi:hypothetical protein